MRIHPDDKPLFQLRSKQDVGEEALTEPQDGGLFAKADLALHKTGCKGFCGLHFSEPEEYLTVHITSKARVADALKVDFRTLIRLQQYLHHLPRSWGDVLHLEPMLTVELNAGEDTNTLEDNDHELHDEEIGDGFP